MPKALIREATATAVAGPVEKKSSKLLIKLIDAGWGSSGHYPAEVLKNAAEAGVWPAGHQMFLDHPGENETFDRPERSLRDLAATLVEGAYWDPKGPKGPGVYGPAQVFGPFVDMLTDEAFADAIGVSIRAYAESRYGEAEGRKGQIVTRIDEAISTDFVTKAGRGGAIVSVMESARPSQVVERAVAHGVAEATANDIRSALSSVIVAAYGGEKVWTWLRDFDEDKAWFSVESPDGAATYEQAYVIDDDGVPIGLDGDAIEVRPRTEYVPVKAAAESGTSDQPTNVPAPAGQPQPNPTVQEDTMGTIQVDEAEHGRLTEAAGRVTALETERDTAIRERDEAREANAARARHDAATTIIAAQAVEAGVTLTALEQRGLLADLPVKEGALDKDAYTETVKTALAEKAESNGAGSIRGFNSTGDTAVTESNPWASIDTHLGLVKEG